MNANLHIFAFILAFVPLFPFLLSANLPIYAPNEWTTDSEEEEGDAAIYDSRRCGLPLKVDSGGDGREFKIMGGKDVDEGRMPWAVAIFKKMEDGSEIFICTGTLVSKRHIMTAAHCFVKPGTLWEDGQVGCKMDCCNSGDEIGEEELGEQIWVNIGSVCLENKGQELWGQCRSVRAQRKFNVKKGSYGQYYEAKCNDQDYAILELDEEVPAEIANHICLLHLHQATSKNESEWRELAKPVKTFGWGYDAIRQSNEDPKPMSHLQMLEMADGIWPEEKCRDAVINGHKMPFFADLLCTEENSDADTCMGDSGGGLIAKLNSTNEGGKDARWFLIGVLSFGKNCKAMRDNPEEYPPVAQVYANIFTNRSKISEWMGTRHLGNSALKSMVENENDIKECEALNQKKDWDIWDEEGCICKGMDGE